MTSSPTKSQINESFQLKLIEFQDLQGWDQDDHAAAYGAFFRSCKALEDSAQAQTNAIKAAAKLGPNISRPQAKMFFETYFQPHRVQQSQSPGLVTGYFEPELRGSRHRQGAFQIPLRKRPKDLVNLVEESQRGAIDKRLTHARKTATGLETFPTRQQIDCGALSDQELEICYLSDPVDKFFMQVQGSGLITLDDETTIRLTYDGKNGLPYTSIGRELIDQGEFSVKTMTLETLGQWLRNNKERARQVMWKNQSYIFFRQVDKNEADGPLGVDNTVLIPGRSLAVDTRYHPIGTPIYVEAPKLASFTTSFDQSKPERGFRQLMIAQDVGSAITGPERGDIFFGTGKQAGRSAGATKHSAFFTVFLPRSSMNMTHVTGGHP